MGVRKTHNRTKESPMGKDLDKVLRHAKQYHKGWGEFYLFTIKYSNEGDTTYYTAGANNQAKTAIKHFKNIAKYGDRAKWVELEL